MNVGLDVGRGNVNVKTATKKVKFEAYCGKARELDFSYGDDNKYIATVNGQKYFIGNIAKREGLSRSFQKNKVDKDATIPLALTGSYLVSEFDEQRMNIVCGLPISDFQDQKDEVAEFLKGEYEVEIDNRKKIILIDQVKVFPEGAGCYFNKILNHQGNVINKDIANSKVGIVDIGYKTTDICVFNNLKFIDKSSVSFPLGIHQAYNLMYKRLIRTEDISYDEVETMTTGEEFEALASKIKENINKFWGSTNFKIYLAGGGAYLLKDYFKEFEVINEPDFANAEGYYKIANMFFRPPVEKWSFGR